MNFKEGQIIKGSRIRELPEGTILQFPEGTPLQSNAMIRTTNNNVAVMDIWGDVHIFSSTSWCADYQIKYLPPQPLQVGDEISREEVNKLPVGTLFSYWFNQTWFVLVAGNGFKTDSWNADFFTDWTQVHPNITKAKIEYLPEGKHYV